MFESKYIKKKTTNNKKKHFYQSRTNHTLLVLFNYLYILFFQIQLTNVNDRRAKKRKCKNSNAITISPMRNPLCGAVMATGGERLVVR